MLLDLKVIIIHLHANLPIGNLIHRELSIPVVTFALKLYGSQCFFTLYNYYDHTMFRIN